MPTVHLIIQGKVQGVFYRASAKEIADRLNLKGWVKNTENGDVECQATGDQQSLDEFIRWCRRGPEDAVVISVSINNIEEKIFTGFDIRR